MAWITAVIALALLGGQLAAAWGQGPSRALGGAREAAPAGAAGEARLSKAKNHRDRAGASLPSGPRRLMQNAARREDGPTSGSGSATQPAALLPQQQPAEAAPPLLEPEQQQQPPQLEGLPAELEPVPPAPPPTPPCLDLQLRLGAACQVGIDRLALHFPRGSTDLPSEQQRRDALAALAQGGLPSRG